MTFFIWDQFATSGYHFQESWQPFMTSLDDNIDFGAGGEYDVWERTIIGYDIPEEASASQDTMFRCYDSLGNEQTDEFNFMVCATDVFYDLEECWFCGHDFGADAGLASSPTGTVGDFDNGGDQTWTATQTWTPGDADIPCVYVPTNPD